MDDERADGGQDGAAEVWDADPSERARCLFLRRHGYVLRFFKRQGCSEDEAHELTQEVFLRVSQNIDKLRSAASAEAWLRRIAANLWKNELRHRTAARRHVKAVSLEAEMEAGNEAVEGAVPVGSQPAADALQEAIAAERLTAVQGCLAELPPRMRRCLVLYCAKGRKYREIADLLHLSVETVKSHIHDARRQLRLCVDRRAARSGT